MNKYIKINSDNEIIDVLFEYQERKKDGTEILLGDLPMDEKINGKYITNEYGYPIFTWDGSEAIEKSQTEIDNDPDFITFYKNLKKRELNLYIAHNLLDIIRPGVRSLEDIVARWNTFKTNASSWTTKVEIDDAYDQAITWLNS